ncbi:hypothetical protein BCR37DRAFT_385432 [Protomyces lactucae-debilis]|uniref:Uncharacterized protein n=1 Tax=Protomyces lactucae-debilis TaxID=2754530 RepID=A0A1Y2FUN1_PROLT|nr:uncharacterized protein BCR37DRAFT_385432 [Protomyces lactucae-debilis]ORY86994.1 hypothetical protein BCR37DRAFT_385432 [Protomyces lactucae-debilis]
MKFSLALLLTFAASISAHAVILQASGEGDKVSKGFQVREDVSREGTGRAAQVDTSIIRAGEQASGLAGSCGRTNADGPINVQEEMRKAAQRTSLAEVRAGGEITMTTHVVNGDGRGPFTCQASADDGASWTDMVVTTNVPGGRIRATDFPLKARVPASMTGNAQGLMTVRCMNSARAGKLVQQMIHLLTHKVRSVAVSQLGL